MSRTLRVADSAGVIGAVLAALCCAGAPIILSVLAALGIGFLRSDAILLPFMSVALIVALWGFWSDARTHRGYGPLTLAIAGAVSLVAGVVFVHGMPAKALIGVGAIALVVGTLWNARCRAMCAPQGAATAEELPKR
jgi:mercuric ion transport protein